MTLRELEATVLQLRDEITLATQSSTEQASLADQLLVFERALGRRQAGRIALVFATAASRRQIRTSIATPGGSISAIAKASIELDLTARSLFWQGVYTGLVDEIPPGKVRDFLTDVQENWPVLELGYQVGVVQGLGHGVVNLVQGLALLARLALWASPAGMTLELARMIQNPQAYFADRQAEYERLKKTIEAVHRFLVEFKADPTIVLQWSAELGVAIGEGLGAKIRAFMDEPAYEKGRDIGDVVGQVLFEVLLQILLAVATAGIGNAIRAGAAGGEVAARSGRLALAIRRVLEASPAVRRLVMEFAGHAELASDVARAGRGLEEAPAAARGLARASETAGAARTAETAAETSRVAEQAATKSAEELGPGERAVEHGLTPAETPRPTEPARPVPEEPEPAQAAPEKPEPGRAPGVAPRVKLLSMGNPRKSGAQWFLRDADRAEVAASQRGYQVYEYYTREGECLYAGKSGGAAGKDPMSWVKRGWKHIEEERLEIAEADRIVVHAELTEQEAFALEQDRIAELKPRLNEKEGEFTARSKQGAANYATNVQSASRRPTYTFHTDIVPPLR